MPYISRDRRDALLKFQDGARSEHPGELNYLFSIIAAEYVMRKGLRYQQINDVLGALEGAKLEFYRRVAVPYETGKIREAGDVYPRGITGEG